MKAPYQILDRFTVAEDLHIEALLTNQSPKWYVQFQIPGGGKGRQRRKSLGTASKKEAAIRARRFAADFETGRVATGSASDGTLDKLIALRLDELRQAGAAASTMALHKWYFAMIRVVAPNGGRTMGNALTPVFFTGLASKLSNEGVSVRDPAKNKKPHTPSPLAPKTVREVMKAVRRLAKIAEHFVGRDPSKGYKLPRGGSPEIETFSNPELEQLFADPYPGAADIWKFLFQSALRVAEFCWLTQDDVVYDANGQILGIHIHHKTIEGVTWWPKHRAERFVPLGLEAAAILARALIASPGPWAFFAPDTTAAPIGQWRPFRIRNYLDRRLKECGIDHGTPHVFRHTSATYLANVVKVPLPLLQKFLGHKSIQTTMRYLHARNDDVTSAIRAASFSLPTAPTTVPGNANGTNKPGGSNAKEQATG